MKKVDQAISVMEYMIKQKRRKLESLEKRINLSEHDKIFIGDETKFIQAVETLMDAWRRQHDMDLGKIPPNAVDLEITVLGAIILESGSISKVANYLKPEHFYDDRHKKIYSVCLEIHKQGIKVDAVMVIGELRRTGHIEIIGGAYYIMELTAKVSSAANIEYHTRVLMEFAIKRELIDNFSQVVLDCYDDTQDCFKLLDRAQKITEDINEWAAKK